MPIIRDMILPLEKRKSPETILNSIDEGSKEKKMKNMIQSLKYKNSPK